MADLAESLKVRHRLGRAGSFVNKRIVLYAAYYSCT